MTRPYIRNVALFVGLVLCASATAQTGGSSHTLRPVGPANDVWRGLDDLDGDGTPDSICVRLERPERGFQDVAVVINQAAARIFTQVKPTRFWIADVDSTDRYREIAVWDEGPSDDYVAHFFWFDGTSVRLMGEVPGYDILTDGSGVVQGEARGEILHTWFFPAAYRLTQSHDLQFIRMHFITMGTLVRLLVDLPLNRARPDQVAPITLVSLAFCSPVVVAPAGSCGVITRTDDREWCEFHTLDGIGGWFRVTDFMVAGRDPQEVFEGLCFAD